METNLKQLQQIRDDVHKNIIRTVINAGINIDGKYRVLVNDPVPFQLTRVGRDSELICIAGVDGNTCELIDDSEKCIYLRYQDVPIEQLKQLEDQLEKNRFKIFN